MPKVTPFVKYWLPVVGWIVLIFLGSGQRLSAEHTSRFLVPFLSWLLPSLSLETILVIHVGLRKMSHLAEYAILAVLLARVAFGRAKLNWSRRTILAGVFIACVAVAGADEFRQSFAEDRGASPWDVLIDGAGALGGLSIYSRWTRRKPSEPVSPS